MFSYRQKNTHLIDCKLSLFSQSSGRATVMKSRKQARRDCSEQTCQSETGAEAGRKGTALSSETDAFEFPAASETGNSDWFIDNRKLSKSLTSIKNLNTLSWN